MLNISDILGNYVNFFYSFGYFGEYISFLISCILLFQKNIKYFIVYFTAFLLNKPLNERLKDFFKQSRPNNPKKFLDDDKFTKKKFGFPSGHTQLVFFSIMYCYLVFGKLTKWVFVLLLLGMIVIFERYVFRNHTIPQLLFGAFIGCVVAYIVFIITNKIQIN